MRWRWIKWSCCVLLAVFLVGGLGKVVGDARDARRLSVTKNRLKAIGLALHYYADAHDEHFPPAVVEGPDGRPWHSWRALILPYLEGVPSNLDYRFDEPWDSAHNKQLAMLNVEAFRPGNTRGLSVGQTTFLAPVGRRTAWPGLMPLTLSRIGAESGTSQTIAVMEVPDRSTLWSKPSDISFGATVDRLTKGDPTDDYLATLFADGTVRRLRPRLHLTTAVTLAAATNRPSKVQKWPAYLVTDGGGLADTLSRRSVDSVAGVDVSPVSDARIVDGQSTVWCSTFVHGWRELLNELELDSIDFSRASRLCDSLNEAASSSPRVNPLDVETSVRTEPLRWEIACSLLKTMPFDEAYRRFEKPMVFHGTKAAVNVMSMGVAAGDRGVLDAVFPKQFEVLSHLDDQRFAVRLQTTGKRKDQIVLACVKPEPTLEATWERVSQMRRVEAKDRRLRTQDSFETPMIAFDFDASFMSLFPGTATVVVDGLSTKARFEQADQRVRFVLDERGAELYSDIKLTFIGAFGDDGSLKPPPPPKPRHFRFDRPFLLAAIEGDKSDPYLLVWIDGDELLVPADE